jgi:hypothetical protein
VIGLRLCDDGRHTLSARCMIRDPQTVAGVIVTILVELTRGVIRFCQAIEAVACPELVLGKVEG